MVKVLVLEVTLVNVNGTAFLTGSHGRGKEFDDDKKWHHFCVVRNSNTIETNMYADGIDSNPDLKNKIMLPRVVPKAEGKMHLGGFGDENFPGQITDLNIWDRILTEDEISKMAQSCDGSNQDKVKNWTGIRKELTLSYYTFLTSSKC